MDLSQQVLRQKKLDTIGLSKYADHLSNTAIDMIYEDTVLKYRKELILSLLNKILKESNNKEINDILQFKIKIKDLKKLNGSHFVDQNIEALTNLDLTKKNLNYNNRDKWKNYIIVVLKLILDNCDYKLESYQTTIKQDDGKLISLSKYKVVNK